MRALIVSVVILTGLSRPSIAQTGNRTAPTTSIGAHDWMVNVAVRIASDKEDRSKLEQAIETPNLRAFLKKVDDNHARNFDADWLMGVQELSGWRVTGIFDDLSASEEAVEAVHFRNRQSPDDLVVRYRLIKTNNFWRIDDVMFGADWRSIRYEMTKAVDPF